MLFGHRMAVYYGRVVFKCFKKCLRNVNLKNFRKKKNTTRMGDVLYISLDALGVDRIGHQQFCLGHGRHEGGGHFLTGATDGGEGVDGLYCRGFYSGVGD